MKTQIVMEYCTCGSLRDCLKLHSLNEEQIRVIVCCCLLGLETLQNHNVIHRVHAVWLNNGVGCETK